MAETPRFTRGGPITSIELESTIPASQAQELRSAQEAASLLAESSKSLIARGQRLVQEAENAFKSIDITAVEARKKSHAQDLIIDTRLKIDAEIGALTRDQKVKPAELVSKSEAIINKLSNEAVSQASGLGTEYRDFVREKLGSSKLSIIPEMRKLYYQRESSEMRAALDKRQFERKRKMFAPGVTKTEQLQILSEMQEDYASLAGIHITTDEAQKQIINLVEEFDDNRYFELVLIDPQAAANFNESRPISSEKKLNMRQRANSIIDAELNRERQRQNDIIKAEKMRAEKLQDIITDDILLNERDPIEHFQKEEVRGILGASETQNLSTFYHTVIDRKFDTKLTLEQQGIVLELENKLAQGEFTDNEILGFVNNQAAKYPWMNAKTLKELVTFGKEARKDFLSETNKDFAETQKFAIDVIKDNFQYRPGFINISEPSLKGQLAKAANLAETTLRRRVLAAKELARKQGISPYDLIDPVKMADEVSLEFLPLAIGALTNQIHVPAAYKSLVSQNTLQLPSLEFNKILQDHVIHNRLSKDHAHMVQQAHAWQQRFNELKNDPSLRKPDTSTRTSNKSEEEKALLKGAGGGVP